MASNQPSAYAHAIIPGALVSLMQHVGLIDVQAAAIRTMWDT